MLQPNPGLPKLSALQRLLTATEEERAQPSKMSEGVKDITGLAFTTGKATTVPKRFEKLANKFGWDAASMASDDMETQAYANQTGMEVFENTLAGFRTQAMAGFVDSIAAWDMQGLYNMAAGNTEKKYGNWLNEIGKDLREHSNENDQIFQDGDSMWNAAYWAKQGQSLGYTGGIIAEMVAEQIALSYVAPGAGNAAGLASKARLFKMAGQGAFGMMKGVQEGYMNALETQEGVYQKYKDLGYDEEAAQQKANQAASLGFRAEVGPLAAINALQFMATFGVAKGAFTKASGPNLGFSGGVETLIDRALPNISNKFTKNAINFGVNAASEGIEEGIQTGVGKYAEHETLKSTGDASGPLELWDSEMRDSMIGGVLGGGLFAGVGKMVNRFTKNTAAKQYSKAHDNFIKEVVGRTSSAFENQQKVTNEFEAAKQAYNQSKTKENATRYQKAKELVKQAQYNSHLANTVNALQLDYINGKETAFETHVEQMQTLLDAVKAGDTETLKQYNILDDKGKEKFEGSIQTITDTFEQNIKDSTLIKEKLENNLLNVTSDFESAFDITKKEYTNIKALDNAQEYTQDLNTLYTTDRQFNQLTPEGQTRFKLEAEEAAFDRLETLTEADKQRKQELVNQLTDLKTYNAQDARIVDSINKVPYVSAHTSINSLNQSVDATNVELAKLRDEKTIAQKIKDRKKKDVARATTKEEVQEVVAQATQEGTLTPELQAIAQAQQSSIAATQTLAQANPAFTPPATVAPIAGTKEPDADDTSSEDLLAKMFASGALSSGGDQFSPREFSSGQLSEQQKQQIVDVHTRIANKLDTELGRTATFEDFINDKIAKTSLDNVDEMYDAYRYAWEAIGRDIADADKVYQNTFNLDAIGDSLLTAGFVPSNEDTQIQNNESVSTAIVEESKATAFDKDNIPTQRDGTHSQDLMSVSPKPKAAFLGVQYHEVQNADGTISRIPIVAALNDTDLNNHIVLDFDTIKPGATLEVRVVDNPDSITVPDWDFRDNTWVKTSMPFGIWRAKYKVEPGTPAYNNKVPMVATMDGKPIFNIHDTQWYNTSNIAFVENQREIIKQGQLEVQAVRNAVLAGNNKIVIDERRFGSILNLAKLETSNAPIALSEATGDTRLAVAKSFTELIDGNTASQGLVNAQVKLVNKKPFVIGQIYEIRKVNTDEYIALQVLTNDAHKEEPINDVAYNNIKFATIAAVILNAQGVPAIIAEMEAKYGMTISKAREIQQQIKTTTKFDIQFELGDYMGMFVSVEKLVTGFIHKLENNSINETTGRMKYPVNSNYILFDRGVLKIARKDGKPVPKNAKGYDTLQGINFTNITEKSAPFVLGILEMNFSGDNGTFRNTHFDVAAKHIGKANPMIQISSNGSVTPYAGRNGENTYEGYIKDTVKTGVKSFPIQDAQGKTKWVTDVQPMIYYSMVNESAPANPETTMDVAAQAAEEVVAAMESNITPEEQKAIQDISDELKAETLRLLRGIDPDAQAEDYFSRFEFTPEQIAEAEAIASNKIETLSPIQQKVLTNSLFNLILADISNTNATVNLADIVNKINSAVDTYVKPEIEKIRATRDNLAALNNPSMDSIIEKLQGKIDQLEGIVTEKSKIISNGQNSTQPKGDLYIKFERFLAEELTANEDVFEDENGEVQYSFNMSALEKDVKLSFSSNLKIFFAGIKKQKPTTREDITNFAYLNDFNDVDDAIQSLVEVMVGLPSSISDLISLLETKKDNPVYNQILNKIKAAPESIQNEILYKMIQSKLDMQMVLYSMNRETGTYSLKIINPNSSSSDVKLKQQWASNFRNSDLFRTVNEQRVYNKTTVNALIDKIDSLNGKALEQSDLATVKEVFRTLGIEIGDNTVSKLIETQGNNMLAESTGVLGVFKSNLRSILINNAAVENITLEDSANDPYENAKGVTDSVIDLEIQLNGTRVSKSFRVGSKSIQGAIQKMMVYDIKEQLKDINSPFFQALKEIPFSKRNYVLRLLETIPKFRENFDVSFVSLESIKEHGKKVYDDRKINKLANTDNMLTQYAFFQNTLRDLGEVLPDTNLQFKMGHMFNPALSDKEQMVLYSTAVLDLDYKNFDLQENGTVRVHDEVINFLTEQIYDAEFDRIVNTYNNPTNIKNYDGAAKRFLSIPHLNTMVSSAGANIHDAIVKGHNDRATMDAVRELYRTQAMDIVRATIDADVKSKVDVTTDSGSWFDAGFISKKDSAYSISFFDSKYLKSKAKKNNLLSQGYLAQIAAYDFVVNQFLHQNTTYQLIAGDQAMYAPSIKKFTNKDTKEIDNIGFSIAVGESISKRMAMLIAPGNKLANSKGDKYLQIFVNDPVKMTSTARQYIKQYYGSVSEDNNTLLNSLNEVENSIRNLYTSRREHERFEERLEQLDDTRSEILRALKNNNPEIGGYFEIEGTDAQEYTTWKEHVDILFRQGRLTVEEKATLQAAYNKLLAGQDLDPKELAVVMNPIKPVYSGNMIENNAEGKPTVNRVVYIKSSSFPLLPQLTRDFKLDKVREQMEELEAYKGQSVRLSYQTANKVGAIATKLTVNDLYNVPFEELYADGQGKLGKSILELDRNNFKIQQDTPYKTAKFLKKNQEDMTTMGSQMWKILLGNGINKIERKIFPNLFSDDLIKSVNRTLTDYVVTPVDGMISGKDLDKIKFHAESMYFDIQKEMLYDELGIDRETRTPVDTNETVKLLHELLKREVTTRQYPDSIIDNLDLVMTEGELEFMLPIWLSNGSNKFESLLQSIITNRMIQISLPGNQHISSSSEGFEKVSFEELDKKIKSQIVWVNPEHKGELKATIIDGKVVESEVLIQSKFRITTESKGKKKTELIDLTKAPYSTMVDGILVLNPDMISEELMNSFSFRIPTSSHQSGAILKVVGFLPEASGDMLVVPKEHTQQLGEDFDIDKRTVYKSNYEIAENGAITKLQYAEDASAYASIMEAMFGDEYLPHLATDEGKSKYNTLKARTKMLENGMIDVYKSVYLSPDNDIQKKINKILSFDNATNTANLISKRLNSSKDNTYFSIYSDDYQRQQMKLGADGKTGIGVHSNAVTFQAQMERLENPLQIQDAVYSEEGEIIGYTPREMRIGRYKSDGILGRIETLDGERSIGDVHTENQNSSTDNIKAQIMGKRNENAYTMNVLTALTYRGFDMAKFHRVPGIDSVQLPSLLLSQPILRRYVELKEQNKSLTSEFDINPEQTIIAKLFEEFVGEHWAQTMSINIGEDGTINKTNFMEASEYEAHSAMLDGDTLYDNLINEKDIKTWDSQIQLAVLQKFFQLEAESKHLGKYQSLINLSTSGLGVSYFNVLERIKGINDMGYEQGISNIRDLVGNFILAEDFQENPPMDKNDYTRVGDFFIKPTTTEGTVLIQSVSSAEDIMDINFPYKQSFISENVDAIIRNKGKDLGKKQMMDLQYKVTSSIRDYLYATESIGMFEGDVNAERFRLFFDKDGNESLAMYMKKLKDAKTPLLYTNELLKSLNYKPNLTGAPSIIEHQADFNTNFDKTDKYNSFLELVQDDTTNLGMYNGVQMTPRKLAQDLATYSYLANNENGAIGFRDFVNVKYLNVAGVTKGIRDIAKNRSEKNMSTLMNNFLRQFYQHNPDEAKVFSPVSTPIEMFLMVNSEANKPRNQAKAERGTQYEQGAKTAFFNALEEFSLADNAYDFIAIRDTSIKLSDNQYKLFQFDGTKYVRIPVLGTFGFNEYSPDNMSQHSLIYPDAGKQVIPQENKLLINNIQVGINITDVLDLSNGVVSLLAQIGKSNNPKYREFVEKLAPYIDSTTKVKVEPKMTSKGELQTGVYIKDENTIYLNPDLITNLLKRNEINDSNILAVTEEVLLEEIIHSITISQLDKFGTMAGDVYTPNADAPIFISKLVKLHELAKAKLPGEYYNKNIYEFTAGVFVSEEFKQVLDSTMHNGKSLLEYFKAALADMVRYITGSSYSDEVRNSVYELLKVTALPNETTTTNPIEDLKKEDNSTDRFLDMFGSGSFTSGGPEDFSSREFRLPVIKNC